MNEKTHLSFEDSKGNIILSCDVLACPPYANGQKIYLTTEILRPEKWDVSPTHGIYSILKVEHGLRMVYSSNVAVVPFVTITVCPE